MEQLYLGIELGSTRVKSILLDENGTMLSSGFYLWENKLEQGYWTYSLEEAKKAVSLSYRSLKEDYRKRYGKTIKGISGIGISAMMHGLIALDKNNELLTPFRT